jgi:hypothetical protein
MANGFELVDMSMFVRRQVSAQGIVFGFCGFYDNQDWSRTGGALLFQP